jgi:hypothetical protein
MGGAISLNHYINEESMTAEEIKQRTKCLPALAALYWISAGPAVAADVEMFKGRLSHAGNYAVQTLGVLNNTGRMIEWISAECGFFRQGVLLTSGQGNTQKLAPGQRAYFDVMAPKSQDADSAECRIVSAQ